MAWLVSFERVNELASREDLPERRFAEGLDSCPTDVAGTGVIPVPETFVSPRNDAWPFRWLCVHRLAVYQRLAMLAGRVFRRSRNPIMHVPAIVFILHGIVNDVPRDRPVGHAMQKRLVDRVSVRGIPNIDVRAVIEKLMFVERGNVFITSDVDPPIFVRDSVDVAVVAKA